jgi:membrane associated rhomboid family serine protease
LADRAEALMKIFCCPICHGALRGQAFEEQTYWECVRGHGIFVRNGLFFHFPKVSSPHKKSLNTRSLSCPGCSGRLEISKEHLSCRHCSSHWLGESDAALFRKWKERLAEEEKTLRHDGDVVFLPRFGGLSGAKCESSSFTVLWMVFALLATFFLQVHLPGFGYYAVFYPSDPFHNFGANFFVSLLSHANTQHLCCNLFFLFLVGNVVERHLAKKGVLLLFLLSGVAANLVQMAIGSPYPTLGASGGIAGLVTALVLLEPKAHLTLSLWPFPKARLFFPCELLAILWLLIEIHGLLQPVDGINHWAHLSGAVAGFLCVQLGLIGKATSESKAPGTPAVGVSPARPALWR